jgi:DNA polymerase III sliding clamp (beta) subunit (PCNA family)
MRYLPELVSRSSFEVTIDEKIIFSKLVEGEYPEPVALMKVRENHAAHMIAQMVLTSVCFAAGCR